MNPGVYQLAMPEYLNLPAISQGVLKTLLERCPAAAWYESHLNPNPRPQDDTDETDIGSVAHSIILEGNSDCCAVIDPNDYPAKTGGIPLGWTNNAIRAARDAARAEGKIPILLSKMAEIISIADSARRFIDSLHHSEPAIWRAFQPDSGDSEQTIVWNDGGILCRIRPDRLSRDTPLIIDVKTTARSAEPDAWGRSMMVNEGLYFGAAFYRRGMRKADLHSQCFYIYLVVETVPPYLCSLVGVDEHAFDLGRQQVELALHIWRKCVAQGVFPAYHPKVAYPELPPWEDARWQEKLGNDPQGIPYDVSKLFTPT